MKPIYFPFTYVPNWVTEALAAGFKQFVVYQPSGRILPAEMQQWVEADVMEVRVPVPAEDEVLVKRINDFRAYAELHRESKHLQMIAFLRRHGAVPFLGEPAVTRIVSEIKSSGRKASVEADLDPLLNARIFLELAHEFDRQSADVRQGLGIDDQRSRDLLKEISGEKDNGIPATPLPSEIRVEDPAEYMAVGRFQAWLHLYMIDPVDSGLFITSSPAVFNHLLENLASAEKVIEYGSLPTADGKENATASWREWFLEQMKQRVENRPSEAGNTFTRIPLSKSQFSKVALTLYRVPGRPVHLLSRIFPDQTADATETECGSEFIYTLIGLIERQPFNR